jgi:hypothetical protein
MQMNHIARPMTIGDGVSTGVRRRSTDTVRVTRRETARWPWPLPVNSLLGVFDDPAQALAAMRALVESSEGQSPAVWMASGEDGARRLREARARLGVLARLRGLLDGEDELAAQLEEWCSRGATVLLVPASRERTADATAIVTRHGARFVRRTGRWVSAWAVRGD